MLNLQSFRHTLRGLPDLLPYAIMPASDVVMNKDGSFLAAWEFRGPDKESSTDNELAYTAETVNNALKSLGDGWLLHIDSIRRPEASYQDAAHCAFPDALSRFLDEERRTWFGDKRCFSTATYLCATYKPSYRLDKLASAAAGAVSGQNSDNELTQALKKFQQECTNLEDRLAPALALERLTTFSYAPSLTGVQGLQAPGGDSQGATPFGPPEAYSELLAHIQQTISGSFQLLRLPDIAAYLDGVLGGLDLVAGVTPRLGAGPDAQWLGVVSLEGFPLATYPAILYALDSLNIPYRFSTRFICLDQLNAEKEIDMHRKGWSQKAFKLLDQIFFNARARANREALRMAEDAEEALADVKSQDVAAGFASNCVILRDRDQARLEENCREVRKLLQECGFVGRIETINTLEAWLGSLPGNWYANVRRPMITSRNLAHMLPLNSTWGGIEIVPNPFYPPQSPALMRCVTGTTPFWMTPFVGDIGHLLIVGPTGSGKSALLAGMALQARRYEHMRIFAFDKGMSMYPACKGTGGIHYDIGKALAFAPLRRVHLERERGFAVDWLMGLVTLQGMTPNPTHRNALATALLALASQPEQARTLSDFWNLLQDPEGHIKAALRPYIDGGEYAFMFNAEEDGFGLSSFTTFEMEEIFGMGDNVVIPALRYLFHRIEQQLDGKPSILILDEAWVMLGHPLFRDQLKTWLKVLRKANCAVWIATQSLSDAKNSGIWADILESCQTRILLANRSATDPGTRDLYLEMALKEEDLQRIAGMTAKREYFFYHPEGKRVFDLVLSKTMLAFVGASDKESIRRIQELETLYPVDKEPVKWQEKWIEERTGEKVEL